LFFDSKLAKHTQHVSKFTDISEHKHLTSSE